MNYKTYDNYKSSGIDWIGEIPTDWSTFRVKNISLIKSGEAPKFDDEGKYDVIGANGKIGSSNRFNISKKHIIIGRVGASGSVNISPEFAFISDNAFILILNNNINLNYSYYLFKALDMDKLINKNAQPLLTATQIKNLFIPNAPLIEQQQIANYLDKQTVKINAIIAKNEKLIQLLKEKRTALINQVVTKGLNSDVPMKDSGIEWVGKIPKHWNVDRLKHRVILNAKTLTDSTDNNYEFDYVDIGSVSLENGIEKYEHLYFGDAPSRARRIVKKDDVIISTVRTYLKAIAIIPDKENVIVSTGFAVLTPSKIDSRYLGHMVKTEYFTNLVSAHSVGVSYPAINSTELVNLDILIPPAIEQKQIADYLDCEVSSINNIIIRITENIKLLEEYKTSLIHNVVTGKIDVREEVI